MELDFSKHIQNNFPYLKRKRLLLAISAGVDSMVLAHLLKIENLKVDWAHCNFGLRGDNSDQDEAFVKEAGDIMGTCVWTSSFKTKDYASENKVSIQMAARELRYKWFYKLKKNHDFDYIITAHNLNDMLETFLIHITKGTGLKGMLGIPEKNCSIVRPLLIFNKKTIKSYAFKKNIPWREDSSNNSEKYFRNKIRHRIIPVLENLNPQLLNSFKKTLTNLKSESDLIDSHIKKITQDICVDKKLYKSWSIEKLNELSPQYSYLYHFFYHLGFTQIDKIQSLLKAQSGKQLFSSTHRIIKDRKELLVEERPITAKKHEEFIYYNWKEIKKCTLLSFLNLQDKEELNTEDPYKITVDKNTLSFPISIRKWRKGDYFYPLGMKGKKKLSDYFTDLKLNLIDKENCWLLYSKNNIVWIIGRQIDNRFRVTEKSKNKIQITWNL